MSGPFDKSGIIEFFLIEAGEHMQNLNKGLLALEKNPSDSSMIDELFRAARMLKGSAAMMGFPGISDIAHKTEDMLGHFRSGALPIRKDTLNFLFASVDAVKLVVDGVAAGKPEDVLLVDSIAQSYNEIAGQVHSAGDSALENDSLQPENEVEAETETERGGVSAEEGPAGAALKDDLDLAWEKTLGIEGKEHFFEKALPEEEAADAEGPDPFSQNDLVSIDPTENAQAPAPEPETLDAADRKAEKSSGRVLQLSESEVEILLKACKKYRHLLPTYIASVQDEIKTIDKIINKLSKS